MPNLKLYGEPLSSSSAAPFKVGANATTKASVPPIQYDRFCRNGKHPSAHLWNQIDEATNQSVLYRNRELFRAPGHVGAGGGATSNGSRTRYRFAFRSGPFAFAIRCIVALTPQSNNLGLNAYAKMVVFSDAAETVTVGEAMLYHGANPGGSFIAEGLPYIKTLKNTVSGLAANTDYYVRFDEVDDGRILAACVLELQSLTQNGGHFPQNITAQSDIYGIYRENVATAQKDLWKGTGGLALNFAANTDANPSMNLTNTSKNICDQVSTTFSNATQGFKVDLRYRDRLAQTSGIPVTMKVFCESDTEVLGDGIGEITLKDSTGAAVITISNGLPFGAPAWISTTGFLPATQGKYDLHFRNNGGGTVSVWAVSIYEHEA